MSLRPCLECNRHVATTQLACPFCNAALEAAAEVARPPSGLGRAALIAFATGVAACHDEPKPTAPDPTPTVTASAADTAAASATATVAATATATATETATATATATPSATASAVASAAPKDAGVKTVPTATVKPHNMAKPYGAPPSRDRRSV